MMPFIEKPNPSVRDVPDPAKGDAIAQGKYMVALGHCTFCHTPDFPFDNSKPFAGGNAFKGFWGTSYAANLTPDQETGLTETDDEILDILREGTTNFPMRLFAPYHKRATEEDLRAIIAYLRSLPPINGIMIFIGKSKFFSFGTLFFTGGILLR